jgi:hypothetical protein
MVASAPQAGLGFQERRCVNRKSLLIVGVAAVAVVSAMVIAQTNEVEIEQLQPDEVAAGDSFGSSVAIDGDLMVIGAPNSDVVGLDSGLAYVYQWQEVQWVLIGPLTPPTPDHSELFGASVAVSGDWIVVGAPLDSDMGFHAGAVHMLRRSMTWIHLRIINSERRLHWMDRRWLLAPPTQMSLESKMDRHRSTSSQACRGPRTNCWRAQPDRMTN